MIAEIVNTGTELMLGLTLNSHQQWLCRRLADLGWVVARQVAVPDTAPVIAQAIRESLSRADLVITTGGLGPTSDDLTRETIAGLLGRKLREDAETLARLEAWVAQRNRTLTAHSRIQALVPEGATVLRNRYGTAPGLLFELQPNPFRAEFRGGWLIMLPGPRRELHPLFAEQVVPLLRRKLPSEEPFCCRTLRTTGLGESTVQARIADDLAEWVGSHRLELGYCARPGQVDVRLAARGDQAEKRVADAEAIVRARLGEHLFGTGEDQLEEVVVRLLAERKQTVALAESCTGGCLAHRLTNVPGASAVFMAGFVTYSNRAKQEILGVDAESLARHGAVSEPVARAMAEGARRVGRTDYAIAVTGIAGPTGGTPEKPVGTVFIALASARETRVWRYVNSWDRLTFKEVVVQQGLNHLRTLLLSAG